MWLFTFTAARTALTYITIGLMTVIWTTVWYVYLYNNPPVAQAAYYWCSGFLVTGLVLAGIGLVLSMINRSAQQAAPPAAAGPMPVLSLPPNAVLVSPRDLTSPAVATNGQVVAAAPEKSVLEQLNIR